MSDMFVVFALTRSVVVEGVGLGGGDGVTGGVPPDDMHVTATRNNGSFD
jgi:hypothetical protein